MKRLSFIVLISILFFNAGSAQKKSAKVEKAFIEFNTQRKEWPILGVVDFKISIHGASGQEGSSASEMPTRIKNLSNQTIVPLEIIDTRDRKS